MNKAYALSRSHAGAGRPALLDALDLRIVDCGPFTGAAAPTCASGRAAHHGKLSSVRTASLGTIAANTTRRYTLTAAIAPSTGNALQGKTARLRFAVTSTSA